MATVLSEDERKARKKARSIAYYANPEVRAKAAARNATPEAKAVQAAYRATPEGRAKLAAYNAVYRATPEARAKVLAYLARPGIKKSRLGLYLRRTYGITPEQFDALVLVQNGTCAICNQSCRAHSRLSVDHCHATGKVRGLLCTACNTSIGNLKDSPAVLATALRYLAKHGKALTTEEVDELTRDLHHYT